MLFYFVYLYHFPGDENIVIDTSGHLPHYLNCSTSLISVPENSFGDDVMTVFPNPSSQKVYIRFSTHDVFDVRMEDMQGRIVCQLKNISEKTEINSRNFSEGIYFIRAQSKSGKEINRKFLICR
jgi:hypothetical protein